jgi:hypothetical protein
MPGRDCRGRGQRSPFARRLSRKVVGIGGAAVGCLGGGRAGLGRGWAWLGWIVRFGLVGAFSSHQVGYLVAVELGEVVTHHD